MTHQAGRDGETMREALAEQEEDRRLKVEDAGRAARAALLGEIMALARALKRGHPLLVVQDGIAAALDRHLTPGLRPLLDAVQALEDAEVPGSEDDDCQPDPRDALLEALFEAARPFRS